MTTVDNDFTQKNPNKFYCEICDFKCSYNRDYQRHLQTIKHKNNVSTTNLNEIYQNLPKLPKKYICENCDKKYNDRAGLWRHKKKCNVKESEMDNDCDSDSDSDSDKELMKLILKDNSELKKLIIELCKNGVNNNSLNNIQVSNSHNKSFNLQFFLNETCKNAMNIMDFANSIQLKLTDLENVGELGYVEGISKIIIDNLKLLDVTERPVHCSDFKRDVMYVKDEDKWEKENESNSKIKKLIHSVTNKNISLIPEWKQKYPDCTNINSNKSTKINKMIMEVMETDKTKDEKIIKKIAKETTIDKEPI
jgi:hypothetical protein